MGTSSVSSQDFCFQLHQLTKRQGGKEGKERRDRTGLWFSSCKFSCTVLALIVLLKWPCLQLSSPVLLRHPWHTASSAPLQKSLLKTRCTEETQPSGSAAWTPPSQSLLPAVLLSGGLLSSCHTGLSSFAFLELKLSILI